MRSWKIVEAGTNGDDRGGIDLPLTSQSSFGFPAGVSVEAPASENRRCTVAGLFAGVGGLELGLHASGHRPHLLCEIEPAAQEVLRRNFKGVPLVGDVRSIASLGSVDLIAAGFPCQDLSQAGRTKGLEGENSGLVHEIIRILRTDDVPEVLLENVPFMLQLERGAGLEWILSQLEQLSYRWAYRVIDAQAFGVPQRRLRVFVFASRIRDPRTVLLGGGEKKSTKLEWDPEKHAAGFYWTEGTRGLGWAIDSLPTLKGGSTIGIPSPPAALLPDGSVVTPTIEAAERLQGFKRNWTKPAADVVRASYRWKLVGNAVNVRVADWLGSRIAEPVEFETTSARRLKLGEPWPVAAWCIEPGKRWTANIGTRPANSSRAARLEKFLGKEKKPLSVRALRGFLSRLEKSTLRTHPHFRESLNRAVEQLEGTQQRS